jgi:hypothetical protein
MNTFTVRIMDGSEIKVPAENYSFSENGTVVYFLVDSKPVGFFVVSNVVSVFPEVS